MDALSNIAMLAAIVGGLPMLALCAAGFRATAVTDDDEQTDVLDVMVWEYVCATCGLHEGRTDAQWGAPCARCGQMGESA